MQEYTQIHIHWKPPSVLYFRRRYLNLTSKRCFETQKFITFSDEVRTTVSFNTNDI